MKPTKTTISKTIKLPIPGIQFSNKVIFLEKVFDGEIDIIKENDKLNQELDILKERDPSFIHQLTLNNQKEK